MPQGAGHTASVANGDVTLSAEAEDAAGNVGASADAIVTVANASAVSLSHTNASFSALVNVASLQVGSLMRVTPGDPDNSYLVQKLEGTATVGVQMPQGGPFLDQATIDMVRQWITDGAQNN